MFLNRDCVDEKQVYIYRRFFCHFHLSGVPTPRPLPECNVISSPRYGGSFTMANQLVSRTRTTLYRMGGRSVTIPPLLSSTAQGDLRRGIKGNNLLEANNETTFHSQNREIKSKFSLLLRHTTSMFPKKMFFSVENKIPPPKIVHLIFLRPSKFLKHET